MTKICSLLDLLNQLVYFETSMAESSSNLIRDNVVKDSATGKFYH